MVALATYTRIDAGRLAVFSPIVMRDLLRGTLGYQGVIVSDDLGATAAVAGIPPGTRAIDFLNAGGDMIISKTAAATLSMVKGDPRQGGHGSRLYHSGGRCGPAHPPGEAGPRPAALLERKRAPHRGGARLPDLL